MHLKAVNLEEKFSLFHEHWTPKVVGACNGQEVKLARLKGTFPKHAHADADELFLVVDGVLRLVVPDGEVTLGPGEFYVVPKGIPHQPIAEDEVKVMMIEPLGTVNTGDAPGALTVAEPEHI